LLPLHLSCAQSEMNKPITSETCFNISSISAADDLRLPHSTEQMNLHFCHRAPRASQLLQRICALFVAVQTNDARKLQS